MSTIAWDGYMLAADRQCDDSGVRRQAAKIERTPQGELIAGVGSVAGDLLLRRWYMEGAKIEEFPKDISVEKHSSTLIVLRRDGTIVEYDNECPIAYPLVEKFFAWGSGRKVALGALAMGANSAQAIAIASQFDTGTGGGVDAFKIGG